MAPSSWKIRIALVLLISSVVLSVLHVALFRDAPTFLFYIALDIVFVPIQVLLVTIIIEHVLARREKQIMLQKLNMVVGAFFGEAGNRLIERMRASCADFGQLEDALDVNSRWEEDDFRKATDLVEIRQYRFEPDGKHLDELKSFLLDKRAFVIGLLQNPNLLEHDMFTDLLWAVCHLTEELEARRGDLTELSGEDLRHIGGDIQRAFGLLVREWLSYMRHLQQDYPYIFSLSVRMNPFNLKASPVVTE